MYSERTDLEFKLRVKAVRCWEIDFCHEPPAAKAVGRDLQRSVLLLCSTSLSQALTSLLSL